MARQAVNRADEMNLLAQKAGTTVEEFSALNYVSELADLQTQNLVKSYKELSKHLVQATDSASPAASMFRQMGIETRDANGQMLTADALMQNIADRFADTADGASKVAAATKIFGDRLGQEMIPFLNQGSAEIRKLREEALLFGQVVDSKTAKAADEFNDNLTKMKLILQGIVNQVVAEFLPTAARLTSEFVEWVKESNAVAFAVGTLVDSFKTLVYIARLVIVSVQGIGDILEGVGNTLGSLVNAFVTFWEMIGTGAGNAAAMMEALLKGQFQNAKTIASDGLNAVKAEFEVFKESVRQIGVDAMTGWNNALSTLSGGPLPPIFGEHQSPDGTINVNKAGAFESAESEITAIKQKHMTLRQLMEEAANDGQLASLHKLINSENVAEAQRLEDRKIIGQAWVDFYTESHRSAFSYIAEASRTLYAGLSNAISSIVMGTRTAAEAFKELGRQMIAMVVNFVAQRAIAFALEKAMQAIGLGMMKAATASATAAAVALAAAWAPAATAAAIATFGGATAAGAAVPAMMAANAAAGSAIALGGSVLGIAHAGLGYVPEEATYMLQRGERVLAPEQNMDLTEFLSGSGRSVHVTVNLDGREILDYVGEGSRSGQLVIDARAIA